ncbi:MAG TPA: flagellar motor protein [Gammaproteobacteria bacterium]|nr:flagellar motor protein [Gammaproteobacteria bacterium]
MYKSLDILTMLGLLIAVAAILGGNWLEGGKTQTLVQLTAFVIVAGGTIGAILVQTRKATFLMAMRMFPWVFSPPRVNADKMIKKIVGWSQMARRDGLLGLEPIVDDEKDEFSKKALQLLVDGSEPSTIRNILEIEINSKEDTQLDAARVYEAMGGYSPTIGIIGAVMGLIHVMNNLADPGALGAGIAVAFVATIYGVGLANLFFLPVANKLKSLVNNQIRFYEMVMDGISSIAEGENPRNIEIKLQGYLL